LKSELTVGNSRARMPCKPCLLGLEPALDQKQLEIISTTTQNTVIRTIAHNGSDLTLLTE
jgi:hypothetical protein